MSESRKPDGKLASGWKVCPKCQKDIKGPALQTCYECKQWIGKNPPRPPKAVKVVAKAVVPANAPAVQPDPYTFTVEAKNPEPFTWTKKFKNKGEVIVREYPGQDVVNVNSLYRKMATANKVMGYLEDITGFAPTEVSERVILV